MEVVQFTILSTDAGTRLSDYLEDRLLAFIPSKKGIKKAVKRELVLVNELPSSTGYRLQEGDVVALIQRFVKAATIQLPVQVVFEDDDLAVVVKPSGLPTSGNMARTLKNALPFNLLPSKAGYVLPQPLPVHRLDGLTSGLVLVAKTSQASIHLSRQFQLRQVKKTYVAVVSGKFPEGLEMIKEPLDGKAAISGLTVVKQVPSLKSGQLTLVRVFPETGRTHQIRRHLAGVGCPILGDQLYAGDSKTLKGKGLFLCAVGLEFSHPVLGEKMTFGIDAPAKFKRRMQYEKDWYERYR